MEKRVGSNRVLSRVAEDVNGWKSQLANMLKVTL